jgi:hypothetical protein
LDGACAGDERKRERKERECTYKRTVEEMESNYLLIEGFYEFPLAPGADNMRITAVVRTMHNVH